MTYGFKYDRDEAEQRTRTKSPTLDSGGMIVRTTATTTTQFLDVHADNVGFYLQDEISVFDRLSRIPSVRYDSYRLTQETNAFPGTLEQQSRNADEVSPNIGAVFALTDSLTARVLFALTLLAQREPSRTLTELRCIEAVAPAFPGSRTALRVALQGAGSRADAQEQYP
jgi:outer membrane receptor for ferric coprogen and ferric-rhodotorulic acid